LEENSVVRRAARRWGDGMAVLARKALLIKQEGE
jgi:hypothetical protein